LKKRQNLEGLHFLSSSFLLIALAKADLMHQSFQLLRQVLPKRCCKGMEEKETEAVAVFSLCDISKNLQFLAAQNQKLLVNLSDVSDKKGYTL